MVTSIAGYIFVPQDNLNSQTKKYKNHEFVNINVRLTTNFNAQQVSILKSPELIQEQNVVSISTLNSAEKIYLSFNPTENVNRILFEINNLLPFLKPRVITSCYEDMKECKSLPLKICNDATDLNKVIIIKIENNTNLNYNKNCLEIKGSEENILGFIDDLIISAIP